MISFDLECSNGHRFEGMFSDYSSFDDQLEKGMINCPVCASSDIKRLYTGCSIQAKSTSTGKSSSPFNIFEGLRMIRKYVYENYENVGCDFADVAREIHYGGKERNIYGESTLQEAKELLDEGISVMPIPDIDKFEN